MDTRILDRIRKLNALAGNNPSEQEATLAAQKVQELLMEYNLTMRDIETREPEKNKQESYGKAEVDIDANKLTMTWKSLLFSGVARLNFCSVIRLSSATTRIAIIGKRSNVEVVCYLSDTLINQIERLSREASRHVLENKAMYQREFCRGAASRVLARMREQNERAQAASETCTALMRVTGKELDIAVKGFFPHLTYSSHRVNNSTGGYRDGQSAANGIGLNRGGIGQGQQRQISA